MSALFAFGTIRKDGDFIWYPGEGDLTITGLACNPNGYGKCVIGSPDLKIDFTDVFTFTVIDGFDVSNDPVKYNFASLCCTGLNKKLLLRLSLH